MLENLLHELFNQKGEKMKYEELILKMAIENKSIEKILDFRDQRPFIAIGDGKYIIIGGNELGMGNILEKLK